MGYTPDILHLVDNSCLKDIGIKAGDVIRLKQNFLQWLNSSASKRKQGDHLPSTPSTPPNKKVCFEKHFHDGGAAQVYGPCIAEANDDVPVDLAFDWFFYCDARDAWVPIPLGCVPVLEHEV